MAARLKIIALLLALAWVCPNACDAAELFDTFSYFTGSDPLIGPHPFGKELEAEERILGRHVSPERRELHLKILQAFLDSAPYSNDPHITFLAGIPGAGKSTVLNGFKNERHLRLEKALVVDPDKIRDSLPEYSDFIKVDRARAAEMTHSESSFLARVLIRLAVKQHKDIVVDASFTAPKYFNSFVDAEHEQEFHYHRTLITVKSDDAVVDARVKERGLRTGRGITPEAMASFRENAKRMEPMLDSSQLFNETFRVDATNTPRVWAYHGPTAMGRPSENPVDQELSSFLEKIRPKLPAHPSCADFYSLF